MVLKSEQPPCYIVNAFSFKHSLLLLMAALVIAITGCASPKKAEQTAFFPPPPELPRVKFLTSYVGDKDLGGRSGFDVFIMGEQSGLRLDKPYGVAMYQGKIYVCDTNSTVMVFDLEKKTLLPLRGAEGSGKLLQPINISIDADGTKYVADPVRGQVIVFDKNDFYVNAFGGTPNTWKPLDAVAFGDRLYVADAKNNVIKVFDKRSGAFLKEFGQDKDPKLSLTFPTNLAFDKEGYLYVSDSTRFQVMKYDRDGHLINALGSLGAVSGSFARPRGVAVDRENRLYVVDAAFSNVQIFTQDWQLLMTFGKAGIGPGDLFLPAKVTIDYDDVKYFQQYAGTDFAIEYIIIVTNQFEKRLVSVYGFGKQKGKTYPTDEELREELKKRVKTQQESPAKTGTQGKKD